MADGILYFPPKNKSATFVAGYIPDTTQGSNATATTLACLYPDGTEYSLDGLTITGYFEDRRTETVYGISGTLAGSGNEITWTRSAADVGASGRFNLWFEVTDGSTTERSFMLEWDVFAVPGYDGATPDEASGLITAEQLAWLVAAKAQVPNGSHVATRDIDGVAGNLAELDAEGNAVDSGYTVIDEDDMVSDSATAVPTQQSVKAYVDDTSPDPAGTLSISSVNQDSPTQTHAIITSSNPGESAAILASDTSGQLTLPIFNASDGGGFYQSGIKILYVDREAGAAYSNVVFGVEAGSPGVAGLNESTWIGYRAGNSTTTERQTAIGAQAGENNSGTNQTGVGFFAGRNNTGNAATVVGSYAGNGNGGINLVALGYQAGSGNTGASSTMVGYQAGLNNTHNNVIALGAYSRPSKSNQLAIGGQVDLNINYINAVTVVSGTAGGAFEGLGTSSTTSNTQIARIAWSWNVNTHATREGALTLYASDYGGERNLFRGVANGTEPEIGFYGVAPVARQLLATGVGATADDIITALQNLGLVKQA